jgi:uncharacterized protein (TIGR03437 family)
VRNRHILAVAAFGLLFGMPAVCQTGVNSVRVYTEPAGVFFEVDSQSFQGAANLLWPAGSKHTVSSYDQDAAQWKTRHIYKGWVTNLSPSASPSVEQPITADPSLKWIKLVFDTSYAITISLVPCPSTTQPCVSAGRVEIVGAGVFDRDTEVYVPSGTAVIARAYPNSGYVFVGWGPVTGFAAPPTAFSISFALDGPRSLSPQFQPTAAVQVSVNIQTDPPDMEVLADRAPYRAPAALEWGWNTVHSVGASEVQVHYGTSYVFSSWSDGGAINHDIVVPASSQPLNLTARFVPGAAVSFHTSPPGLQLSIDGNRVWPSYNFIWAPGSTHEISAPANQADAAGHRYQFVSWSTGKPGSFVYTTGPGLSSDHVTAVYRAMGQVTVSSRPAGVTLSVDGGECVTPCTLERPVGTEVQLSAPDAQQLSTDARLVFQGWLDSRNGARVITVAGDSVTYTAAYTRQFRLSLLPDPPEGAVIQTVPDSTDNFYDDGTSVAVSASVQFGFRTLAWSGDLSGKSTSGLLVLDSPRTAVLSLKPVPGIIASGVRNAASDSPGASVAPGSLISIYGVHFASDLLAGRSNPLEQTLGGVTVRIDGLFLPLLFLSPGQINAQLISDLEPGAHTLVVRVEGEPETAVNVDVARNAPGLFSTPAGDARLAIAVHEDGTAVTIQNPASAGETVTVLGTGFGPYRFAPPDGFVVGESDSYSLADPVELIADGVSQTPVFAGRSGVGVGIDAVRFRLPARPADASFVNIKVKVNQSESNTVLIPLVSATRASIEVPAN